MIQCRSAFPPARIGAQLLFHPSILTIENITDICFPIWRLRGRCAPRSRETGFWSQEIFCSVVILGPLWKPWSIFSGHPGPLKGPTCQVHLV